MLIPPSTTQPGDDSGFELSELFKGIWLVREEIEIGLGISCDIDSSFMNSIIDPMGGNIKGLGDLRYSEEAGNPAGM